MVSVSMTCNYNGCRFFDFKINMSTTYKTSDLNTCVVLQYFNHLLVAVDKDNARKCVFNLEKTDQTESVLEDFYQGKLLVEPKKFASILKDTKGRIYN